MPTMKYVTNALSAAGAIFVAEFILALWWMFRNANAEKATGMGLVAWGFVGSLVSPLFWVLALLFFFLFFYASKLQSSALRVLLFWIPAVFCSSLGLLFVGMFAYLFVRFRTH